MRVFQSAPFSGHRIDRLTMKFYPPWPSQIRRLAAGVFLTRNIPPPASYSRWIQAAVQSAFICAVSPPFPQRIACLSCGSSRLENPLRNVGSCRFFAFYIEENPGQSLNAGSGRIPFLRELEPVFSQASPEDFKGIFAHQGRRGLFRRLIFSF